MKNNRYHHDFTFLPKRQIFAFGENQMPEVEKQVQSVKETVKELATKGLDQKLKDAPTVDDALNMVKGEVDKKVSPQVEQMQKWAQELRDATAFKSARPNITQGLDRITAIFTDSEIKRAQQATQLDNLVSDLNKYKEDTKVSLDANKAEYEGQKKQITEVNSKCIMGNQLIDGFNTGLKPTFDTYAVKFTPPNVPVEDEMAQLKTTHDNMQKNIDDSQKAVDDIKGSPIFSKYPDLQKFVTDLQGKIDQAKGVQKDVDKKFGDAQVYYKEGSLKKLKDDRDQVQQQINVAYGKIPKVDGKPDNNTKEYKDYLALAVKRNDIDSQMKGLQGDLATLKPQPVDGAKAEA